MAVELTTRVLKVDRAAIAAFLAGERERGTVRFAFDDGPATGGVFDPFP